MKKLMTVLASTAAALCAFGLSADLTTTGSSIESSGYVVGQNLVSTTTDPDEDEVQRQYWYIATADGGDNGVVVSNYEASATTTPIATRPEKFKDDVNTQFLALDTSSPLYRTALPNTQNPAEFSGATIGTGGIYLDTLVKFTAADDVFGEDALADGDKIAISYVEQSDEVEDPITNFVIRAGYVNGSVIVPTNYVANAPANFDKNAWHRLTVRTLHDVGSGVAPVAFVVYVDQVELSYSTDVAAGDAAYVAALNTVGQGFYNAEKHQLFPSALGAGDAGGDKIYAAAFSGTGAIDDVVFTTDKPKFINETVKVSVTWDEHVKTLTLNGTSVDISDEGMSIDVEPTNGVVDVVATFDDGYVAGKYSVTGTGAWDPSNAAFTNLAAGAKCDIVSMLPLFDVDGAYFDDVEDAIDAAVAKGTASNPATVKLLADCNDMINLTEGYIVIDLNGHDLQAISDEATFTIINAGATLAITNSGTEASVKAPIGAASSGAMLLSDAAGFTTVQAGTYELIYVNLEGDETTAADALKITGGKFFDVSDDPDAEEHTFYLADCVDTDLTPEYLGEQYFQVGEGSEQPTTYALTIPAVKIGEVTAATATVTADEETISDFSAIPAGTVVTVTWTAANGYKITAGDTETITMSENKTATAPTVQAIVYATLTITPVNNCTIVVSNATAEVASGTTFDVDDNVTLTVYRTPAEGFKLADGCAATEVITMDEDQAVTASVVQDGEKTYPSYIGTDTEKKEKYDAWAKANNISDTDFPDADGTNKDAYLLNCAPDKVEAEKAAFKFTSISYDADKEAWVTETTTQNTSGNEYNGTVTVKQYSDVGCETESPTGTFFRAVLQ